MKIRALALGAVIGFVVAVAPSCGPAKCGPANCGGCCTADDKCVASPNNENAATCGSAGGACVACTAGQVCGATFTCVAGTNTGGGTGGGTGNTGGGTGNTGGGTGNCSDGCTAPNGTCQRYANQSTALCGTGGAVCAGCPTGYDCVSGVCTAGPNADCVAITLGNFQFLQRASQGYPYYGGLISPSIPNSAPNSQTVVDFAQLAIASNTLGSRDFATDTAMQFATFEDYDFNAGSPARFYVAVSGTFDISADAGSIPLDRPLVGDFSEVKFAEADDQGNPISGGKCLILHSYHVNVPAPDPAPSGWTCDNDKYDDGNCWCACGVADVDCSTAQTAICNSGWTCQAAWKDDGSCDCGCGVVDSDCMVTDAGMPASSAAACDYCDACLANVSPDAGISGCGDVVVADNNAACISTTPADAGTDDAGTDVDAGADMDAGADVDAGADMDAGTDVDAGADMDAGTDTDAGTDVDAGP